MKTAAAIAAVAITALGLTYAAPDDRPWIAAAEAPAPGTPGSISLDRIGDRTVYDAMRAEGFNHAEIVADLHRHGIPEADWFGPMPAPGGVWTVHPETVAERDARLASGLPATYPPAPASTHPPTLGEAAVPTPAPPPTTTSAPPPETTLPPYEDVVNWVNSLPYQHGDPEPADAAFRAVAAVQGWSPERIEAWDAFARDVFIKESGSCWNGYRGAVWTGDGCELQRQGRYEDAGFGQVISDWYGRGNPLCEATGLCSKADVVASPFNSMTALVFVMGHSGSFPWCWVDWARDIHNCWLAPDAGWWED